MAMKKRPAKDIKPTDLRSKALQEAKTAKTKRLAAEMKKKATAQVADKKVRPAKDLNKGGTRAKFLKDAKSGKIKVKPPTVINTGLSATAASRLMKLGSTAALAATFYLGDTFSTKTGGAAGVRGESDVQPKYGMSLKEKAAKRKTSPLGTGGGNPKTVNSYRKPSEPKPSAATPSGTYFATPSKAKPKDIVGNNPNRGLGSKKADDFRKKQQGMTAGTTTAATEQASNASAPAIAKKPAFKGNWTGAGATEMQKRGGAKIKRPNLLSLFRKKK